MDVATGAVRGATLLLAAFAVAVLVAMAIQPGEVQASAVTARDGSPLQLPAGPAVVEGEWANVPVLVFKVDSAELAGADATPSIAVPGEPGLRLFVLSAKSTHLGCTVGYLPGITGKAVLPANPDAPHILLDVCHQGQWDPFHDGRPLRGPAPARLAGLDVAFKGGALVGDGFDGPVGPQPRA